MVQATFAQLVHPVEELTDFNKECHALILNQAPNDSKAKSLWFLHGIEYPEDYRDC